MQVCFVDEAGDLGALGDPPLPNDQPVLVVAAGLFVDVARLDTLTDDFLDLKQRYFPGLPYRSPRPLDRILPEIKGADVRANAIRGTPRQRRHAIGFLDRPLELPTFGHSENHAGLQVCDLVCSALLYPIACFAYCTGHVNNVHVQPRAADLRHRYGRSLKALQYRYRNPATNRYEGGVVVSDAIGQQNGSLMFRHASA